MTRFIASNSHSFGSSFHWPGKQRGKTVPSCTPERNFLHPVCSSHATCCLTLMFDSTLSLRENTSMFLSCRQHLKHGWFSVTSVCLTSLPCGKLRFQMQTCIHVLPPCKLCLTPEEEQSSCCSEETKDQVGVK